MTPFIVWLVFCLLVLLLCWAKPNAGRIFVGLFFLLMALGVNVLLVLVNPESFVALGTDAPVRPLYRWFFARVVALAPPLFGLLAVVYEITVALMILNRGKYVRWGLVGGIVFLLGITPLGVWTLPNPVLALALALLLRKSYDRRFPELLRLRSTRQQTSQTN